LSGRREPGTRSTTRFAPPRAQAPRLAAFERNAFACSLPEIQQRPFDYSARAIRDCAMRIAPTDAEA
jgi:hypothetical protein